MFRDHRRPGRLILICGLPGAGKTTFAKHLERELGAVRVCPDEWKYALGVDFYDEGFRVRLEKRLSALSQELLGLGQTVILEFGFWARIERDEKREAARAMGAAVELHFLDLPLDELWRRVERRNSAGEPGTVPISRANLEHWATLFQAPDAAELRLYDRPLVSAWQAPGLNR
jgi:predicted kinase